MALLSPLLIILALIIRLDSQGPIIYRHRRVGHSGKIFDLLKFRSMLWGADDSSYMQYLQQLIESEQQTDGKGMPYRK